MAFKIGDKARISYNWLACASDSMVSDKEERDKFAGKVITIEEIDPSLNGDIYFDNACQDERGHVYGWFADQLESVEDNEMKPIIKDCEFYNHNGRCMGTREMDPCGAGYCPRADEVLKGQEQTGSLIKGVEPDAPVTTNAQGGKQSDTPYAFHMLPTSAIFGAAEVCAYGAKKYGETVDNRNYTKIPTEEHINHAIQHLYAYLAGDKQDDHLGHAVVRCMFAFDTAHRGDQL